MRCKKRVIERIAEYGIEMQSDSQKEKQRVSSVCMLREKREKRKDGCNESSRINERFGRMKKIQTDF